MQLFPWLFWYASELALKFWMAIICAGFPAYDHILDMSECLKTFGWFNLSLPRQVVAVAAAIVMVVVDAVNVDVIGVADAAVFVCDTMVVVIVVWLWLM